MWEPNDLDLVKSWLAYRQLRKSGKLGLNPWGEATKAVNKYKKNVVEDYGWKCCLYDINDWVEHNPHDFLLAYNNGMGFMKGGGCVHPETFPKRLGELCGHGSIEGLFPSEDVSDALRLLKKNRMIKKKYYHRLVLRPFIVTSFFGFFFTEYKVESGEVKVDKSIAGIKFGDRPSAKIANITRMHATGTIVGNIVFGEGSAEPVVWKNVFRPESTLRKVKAFIGRSSDS